MRILFDQGTPVPLLQDDHAMISAIEETAFE
jgi:hypothetical protein